MDKRVVKTKRNIRNTLVKLLDEKPFEKITVAEICREGEIGRITFYSHYDDKYALVEEIFNDFVTECDIDYHRLQKENNPNLSTSKSYDNLLACIVNVFANHEKFLHKVTSSENPYLKSALYQHLFTEVDSYIRRHKEGFHSKYPSGLIAALICSGLFGVIGEGSSMGLTPDQIRDVAESMLHDLMRSSLFVTRGD